MEKGIISVVLIIFIFLFGSGTVFLIANSNNLGGKIAEIGKNVFADFQNFTFQLPASLASFSFWKKSPVLVETDNETNNETETEAEKEVEATTNLNETGIKSEEENPTEPQGILDDIREKTNLISNEVDKLVKKQEIVDAEKEDEKGKVEEEKEKETDEEEENEGEETVGQDTGQVLCQKTSGAIPARNKVIFNEIAWMGTTVSANDEWIELKTLSSETVNLAGWQILDKNSQIKVIFADGDPVSVSSFYLLERTNDSSVQGIAADKIYKGALNDSDESLFLFDANCQFQDEVIAEPNWPTGDKTTKRTAERKLDLNWQTSLKVGGTPKKENSTGYVEDTGGGGTPPPPAPDTIPPTVSFVTSSLQITPFFILSWTGEDLAPASVTPSGIDGFQLRYSESGDNWIYFPSDIQYTSETQYNFTGQDEKTYNFQIKAKDKNSNESAWTSVSIEINILPVVINEIAWMGTEANTADEWIELYNNTHSIINLSGWTLKSQDGTPIINLSQTIQPKSFYLLERTDNETVPGIDADQFFTGALGNEGEEIGLYDQNNNLIEKINCTKNEREGCKNWFAGENDTKQTMERKNPRSLGNQSESWATSQNVGGTPKAQNSVYSP